MLEIKYCPHQHLTLLVCFTHGSFRQSQVGAAWCASREAALALCHSRLDITLSWPPTTKHPSRQAYPSPISLTKLLSSPYVLAK